MGIGELIELKKNKKRLTENQINFFIDGVVKKSIPDYQTSALLMAIFINGLNSNELYFLTKAMINSGTIHDFHNDYKKILVDKHSTGGIGDKVSMALAPLLTCFDLGISKLSGRGLGFTGGTIDKLHSIGVNTNITIDEAKKILKTCDMFIIEQTADIVPADKILYALRDVTGTVDSLPLIAASILSKKFALSSDYIFIDIKYGQGAFCKNMAMAKKLGEIMQKLASQFKRKLHIVFSSMNNVLGRSIGNAIEVREVVDYLQGHERVSSDFVHLIEELVVLIATKTKVCKDEKEVKKKISTLIQSGEAFEHFCKWVQVQGGDAVKLRDGSFFNPQYHEVIKAKTSGKVIYDNVIDIAELGVDLGAGRRIKSDQLDYQAGIYLHAKNNEKVQRGEDVVSLYCSKPIVPELISRAEKLFKIR